MHDVLDVLRGLTSGFDFIFKCVLLYFVLFFLFEIANQHYLFIWFLRQSLTV